MSANIEHLTHEALSLSENERAELAHRLLLSLDERPDEGVQDEWEAEIAKRAKRVHDGTAKGRPAEDVFRDIRASYQ